MRLKFITRSGETAEIQVEELLSVDGKPYRQDVDTDQLRINLAKLDGRLTTIERAIFGPPQHEGQSDG